MLEELGYEIRVFNLIEKAHSCCYNPFVYIHKQSDVFKLVTQLIKNTNPPGNNSSADPFWEKSEIAIMEAIFFYLWMECPKEEQNFKSVMELLQLASASEDDENQDSDLDIMFRQLEEEKGSDHIACKQYGIYKKAGGKTAKSILISVGVRLSVFNLDEIQDITYTDNISLDTVGDKKTAVYIVIPDDDKAFNFLVSMLYSQLFGELYFQADFGNLKWDNDKISLRSKESLIQHKNKLLQLYEKYGMTKGEKKKLQLKKSINQLMTNVNHEFGIPVPAPEEINKKFVNKYISAMEECFIRISNKTATLKTYLQEWDNINQKIDLIKSSKAEQALKVKNINKLRIKKQTLKERMEKEYGLRSYHINNQKTEQAFLQEASLLYKELFINSSLYGTKESFYEKTKKISHLQKILKTKSKECKEYAFWQRERKKVMKEREAIENEIKRIELIAEFEFGIPHLSKMQKKSGRLAVHVRCILDEFANISPIPDFQNLIATMRSREISATIILQTLSQIKEMYKDSWETITGNCDTYVFLGGQEQSTLEYTSKKMGKATIDKRSTGHSKGRQGSFSQNWDTLGRELMQPDEIAKMDNEDCLLFIRGKNPIYDKKYSLDKHPRYEMIDEDGTKEYDFKAKFNTKLASEEMIKEKNMLGKELFTLMEKKFNQILDKLNFQLEPVTEEELSLLPAISQEPVNQSDKFIETYKKIVKNILAQEDILEDMQYDEVVELVNRAAQSEAL